MTTAATTSRSDISKALSKLLADLPLECTLAETKALLLHCLNHDTDHMVCDVDSASALLRGYDEHTSGFDYICIIRASGKSEGWRYNAHLDGYWQRAGGSELLTTHCLMNRLYRARTITAVEIWPR
jgi:hypothetical protein